MKRYYVKNGRIVINKYAVTYCQNIDNGDSETKSNIVQYTINDNELDSLLTELSQRNIDFIVSELNTDDILKYDGLSVSDEEGARRIIEPSLDEVKADKIKELSDICRETIYNGIEIKEDNGNILHFSLKTEDQLNLNRLSFICENYNDKDSVIYHANGEDYREFSKDEFLKIVKASSEFISKETMYYGKLKKYVEGLSDIHTITNIKYGIEL